MVQKIEKSSYIITLMESLSQIYNFSHYFLKKDMSRNEKSIAEEFQNYIQNLWNEKEEGNTFVPKSFMKKIIKITDKKFSIKEELEPYIFYDYILDQLNKELRGNDENIIKYYKHFYTKYKKLLVNFIHEMI